MIGDVIGKPGRRRRRAASCPASATSAGIDFVTANGENVAGGMGLTVSTARGAVRRRRRRDHVAATTSGTSARSTRTSTRASACCGRSTTARTTCRAGAGARTRRSTAPSSRVINLQGRTYMQPIDNPFTDADRLLDEASEPLPPIRLVDFHCELTSEKNALGLYLDGRVSVVVGTHTHVVTGDERILPKGTAYQTDLGMTGPVWSVIGFNPDTVLPRFVNALPTRFEVGDGPGRLQRLPGRRRPGDRPRARRSSGSSASSRSERWRRPDPRATPRARRRRAVHPGRRGRGRPRPLDPLRRRPRARRARSPGVRGGRPPVRASRTTTTSPATASSSRPARRRCPPDLALVPAVEINAITRGLGLGLAEGELHVLGIGVDPGDEAFEAALAAQRGAAPRTRFCATVDAPARARACRSTPRSRDAARSTATTRSAARRSPARSSRPASPRASRTRSAGSSATGQPGYVPRTGSGRSRRSTRSAPRAASPRSRTSGEAPDRISLLRDLIGEGLDGLESHHRSFDAETRAKVAATARALGLVETGGTDYHGDLGHRTPRPMPAS